VFVQLEGQDRMPISAWKWRPGTGVLEGEYDRLAGRGPRTNGLGPL